MAEVEFRVPVGDREFDGAYPNDSVGEADKDPGVEEDAEREAEAEAEGWGDMD